jgi:hypothetical protein
MHLQKNVALIPVNIASTFRPVQRIKKMCLAFKITAISKDVQAMRPDGIPTDGTAYVTLGKTTHCI